ncbi:cAMP-dependent protein kinase type 2 [Venturia nashicola]|uniref:RNA helicase n=1 Tax=Venturia nashicola TaxID=86259 RepID=A0A4Z1NLZ9_9PEZI|nr:cAMP-dependent protein kinase type 2 [Venturia nashicola]TLD21617.1 cAMP-dependent protein kinase type 2 [Venturia nashicola]
MSRLPPSTCLFCQARSSIRPQWQQGRSLSGQPYKTNRPSRMELSPNVSKKYDDRTSRAKPAFRSRNSPFGGMNLKRFPDGGIVNERSAAEIKRSARGAKEKPRKEEGFRALKMQQTLATVGYGARSAVKERIETVDSFDDFPLLPGLRDSISPQALKGMEDIAPTPIQRLAIPALLGTEEGKKRRRLDLTPPRGQMREFLLAAETGSGKTLAYLLPTIDDMKRYEIIEAEKEKEEKKKKEEKKQNNIFELEAPPLNNTHYTTGRPRVIVLVPTAELVDQVGAVAKSLSHTVKFRAAMISSAYSGVTVRNRLFNPAGIDILISTPHLLASITESDPNVLSRVSHLIVDEADSLFDRSFAPFTSAILDRATPSLKQLILCSATIPKRLDSYIRKRFPDIRRLTTPNLHAIPRRVQLGVVDVEKSPFHGNKDLACADTIWTIGNSAVEHSSDEMTGEKSPTKRILVFVNEREKTIELANYLVSKGIDAIALNRDADVRKQVQILGHFTSASPTSEEEAPMRRKEARKQGIKVLPNTKVLVVTDLASRGIDTTAVRHVVLYDVPHTTIDFIHRLGRTGRMGRRGRGVVLVGKNDRRDVVKEVRDGMFKGTALI